MPTDLEHLLNHVTGLAFKFKLFDSMYGNRDNVDKMNQLCPVAFRMIQDALTNEIIRTICALTDPASTGNRENLVLERFRFDAKAAAPHFAADIDRLFGLLEGVMTNIRPHRNKRLAHHDLATMTVLPNSLPTVMHGDLARAKEVIFDIATKLEQALLGSETAYRLVILNNTEGQFEWMLRDAIAHRTGAREI